MSASEIRAVTPVAPSAQASEVDLSAVLADDESAWRTFVAKYDPLLRDVVRHATEATHPLSDSEVDDVLGDFWLAVVANNKRMLRSFDPRRGSDLLTWLTFHVAQIACEQVDRAEQEPEIVPLLTARKIADRRPTPSPTLRAKRGNASTIDAAIRQCVRSEVAAVLREELTAAKCDRDKEEADRPRSAAWWAERLGCSAESLIKRAKRGSLEYVRIGARYYFTKAQVEGSRRWRRA